MRSRGASSGKSISTLYIPDEMECVIRQPTVSLLFAKSQLWNALVGHDEECILKLNPRFIDVIF